MSDYSNSKFEITILEKYIYKVCPFEGIELDVEDIIEMRAQYLKFSDGKPFAILLNATKNFSQTREARVMLASKEYTDMRMAAAFVTTTLANKISGNFFINFNRPASPTKLFTTEAAALRWLQKQVKELK